MKHITTRLTLLLLMISRSCIAQTELIDKKIISIKQPENGIHIFELSDGEVITTNIDDKGYTIQKYSRGLSSVESKWYEFPSKDFVVQSQLQLNDNIYFVVTEYINQEKVTNVNLFKLSSGDLKLEQVRTIMKFGGKMTGTESEIPNVIAVAQSDNKEYWSLLVVRGQHEVKHAEFEVAVFGKDAELVWQHNYQTDYRSNYIRRPQLLVDNSGNVSFSAVITDDLPKYEMHITHYIFCITGKGETIKTITFEQYDNLKIFFTNMHALKSGNLFVYTISSSGIIAFLIDPVSGSILKDKAVEPDYNLLRDFAYVPDGKTMNADHLFVPFTSMLNGNGDIYVVGEQVLTGGTGSVLVVKFDEDLSLLWYDIIPKVQGNGFVELYYFGTQAQLTDDKLSVYFNIPKEFEGEPIYNEKSGIKAEASKQFWTRKADLICVDINADGVTKYKQIQDKPGDHFYIMKNTCFQFGYNRYFVMTDFDDGRTLLCRVGKDKKSEK